ncbi:MAG: hypothetical protein Q8R98_24880, partial [Rubrivivax sp.]|nr:hypothetical protein [Rubrivivax sp.]
MNTAADHALIIYQASTPILKITGLGGKQWRRNDAKAAARTGPWYPAQYSILDRASWKQRLPSMYLVAGDDGNIRYTGISRNQVSQRWRECPAIDAETGQLRQQVEIHHSQCWRHVEREYFAGQSRSFEIRSITASHLL